MLLIYIGWTVVRILMLFLTLGKTHLFLHGFHVHLLPERQTSVFKTKRARVVERGGERETDRQRFKFTDTRQGKVRRWIRLF